ncbi:hypothetical protein [Polyangium spumosum]|uniref:Lipoprotein n=1 Tax=Polyangium spumosum TaxID=889282 RepID=A0A6N7PPS3_9BACT|nr:hypothetical protein [Polyangium spumosum]MRG92195.1 hypothetical protein [Polyangium spumosum]
MTSLFALALVGAASLVGCGDDTNNTTGGNNTPPVALDDLGTRTAEAFCEQVYSCCTMAEMDTVFANLMPKPTNEAECVQSFKAFYDMSVLADLKAAVAAGRLEYDGALAASCFAKVDCGTLGAAPDPECENVFAGKVADGGDCANDTECAGATSVCLGDSSMQDGKCGAPGAVGAACSFDDECATGYCSFSSNMCEEKKALGEACSGGGCKDSYCDFMASVCTARKADGEACTFFDECQSGNCDAMAKTCAPEPAPICDGM